MSDEGLRQVLLRALAADSAYVHDLDAEGRAIAAENGEVYTGSQGVIVDGVIDPEKVILAVLAAEAGEPEDPPAQVGRP